MESTKNERLAILARNVAMAKHRLPTQSEQQTAFLQTRLEWNKDCLNFARFKKAASLLERTMRTTQSTITTKVRSVSMVDQSAADS